MTIASVTDGARGGGPTTRVGAVTVTVVRRMLELSGWLWAAGLGAGRRLGDHLGHQAAFQMSPRTSTSACRPYVDLRDLGRSSRSRRRVATSGRYPDPGQRLDWPEHSQPLSG